MRSPGRPPVARREHRQRFWAAIARGVASEDAGVEAGVSAAVGSRWFRECGGMPPSDFRPHSGRYLSFFEREEIAICRACGYGVREIARHLGRSPSAISRELRRNAGTRGGTLVYRAVIAQWHRDRRAARPKTAKLVSNQRLREYVQDRLATATSASHPEAAIRSASPAARLMSHSSPVANVGSASNRRGDSSPPRPATRRATARPGLSAAG